MMNCKEITPPKGLSPAVEFVKDVCMGKEKVTNLFVPIEKKATQNEFLNYMADMFCAYKVRPFTGLDTFLEYTLDGSMAQINNILFDIKSAAVYTNFFEGIIAFDIGALADSLNEKQSEYFFSQILECAKYATVVFFAPPKSNKLCALECAVEKAVGNTKILIESEED